MHPYKQEATDCHSAKMKRMGLADGGVPPGQPGATPQDAVPKVQLTLGNPMPGTPPTPIPPNTGRDGGGGGADSGNKRGGRVKRASGGMVPLSERHWNVKDAPELKTVTPDDASWRDETHGSEQGASRLWTNTPDDSKDESGGATPRKRGGKVK